MSETHVPAELRRRVAEQARRRCGYCLMAEAIVGLRMEIDHIRPEADGGATVEENLWLACSECNGHKNARTVAVDGETGELVPLFNPRQQVWTDHFRWNDGSDQIIGLTATGRATVVALQLNREHLVQARRRWVTVGWHPPQDDLGQA